MTAFFLAQEYVRLGSTSIRTGDDAMSSSRETHTGPTQNPISEKPSNSQFFRSRWERFKTFRKKHPRILIVTSIFLITTAALMPYGVIPGIAATVAMIPVAAAIKAAITYTISGIIGLFTLSLASLGASSMSKMAEAKPYPKAAAATTPARAPGQVDNPLRRPLIANNTANMPGVLSSQSIGSPSIEGRASDHKLHPNGKPQPRMNDSKHLSPSPPEGKEDSDSDTPPSPIGYNLAPTAFSSDLSASTAPAGAGSGTLTQLTQKKHSKERPPAREASAFGRRPHDNANASTSAVVVA